MEMVYALPKNLSDSHTLVQENDMPDTISDLIRLTESDQRVFPATEYFNETWMLRVMLEWFSKHHVKDQALSFTKTCRWFSEGLIPTQFLPRVRKDPLGEFWTHADGVVGHIEVGESARADVRLAGYATHLTCIEAKMFSRLSAGVTNAPYFNQAARYIACMAEMMHRVKINPDNMKQLALYILAPEERNNSGAFATQSDPDHINETVKRRVSEYQGEKDKWYQEWFLPTLSRVNIECLSWESLIQIISKHDPKDGLQIERFYLKCLEYNRPVQKRHT